MLDYKIKNIRIKNFDSMQNAVMELANFILKYFKTGRLEAVHEILFENFGRSSMNFTDKSFNKFSSKEFNKRDRKVRFQVIQVDQAFRDDYTKKYYEFETFCLNDIIHYLNFKVAPTLILIMSLKQNVANMLKRHNMSVQASKR